jgi:hypothetical protein
MDGNMRFIKQLISAALALTLSTASLAASIDVAGVKVEDSANVAGTALLLNGAGVRVKFVKVYVGSLYASKKVGSLEELLAAPGPKRLTMTMLRDSESAAFGKLLTRGMEDNNSRAEMSKLIPGLIQMGDIFSSLKTISSGDTIMMDWIPGTGMVILVKGKVVGSPFKEPEFYKALMGIWFGPSPADWKLKDAMLGNK